MSEKICEVCGETFITFEDDDCCSDECYEEFWEQYANHQYDGVDFGDEDDSSNS